MLHKLIHRLQELSFLFQQLVKRDFEQKYKGTVFGMAWSVISPLLQLLVMRLVFTRFFGRNTPHYTTYVFCGTLIYSYFRESTTSGMSSLMGNAKIITKINVPKYLFLLSKNVSVLVNFSLTLIVFFIFCAIDKITFSLRFIMLIYPVLCLLVFNIGMGLILSALLVFFRDTSYLYSVFLMILHYMSAIFYRVDGYSVGVQHLFLLNPVYTYIKFFRVIVINGNIPSPAYHALCAFYALAIFALGSFIYKKYNTQFIYYL